MVRGSGSRKSFPHLASEIDLAIAAVILVLIGSLASSGAGAGELRSPSAIAAAARACIEHLVAGRANEYVACLHPSVAAGAGGAEALAGMVSRSRATSRGMGIELTGVTVTEPGSPVKIGERYVAIVHDTVTSVSIPEEGVENAILQPSYYLAILEPGAEAWLFLDGWVLNEELLAKYLPDLSLEAFKQKLTLPKPSQPSSKPAEPS